MLAREILCDHASELATLAAEVGIDWSKAQHQIDWSDRFVKASPLTAKDRGKTYLISKRDERGGVITFRSFRHGGESRSWSFKAAAKPGDRPSFQKTYRQAAELAAAKAAARRREQTLLAKVRSNQSYLAQWRASEDWCDDFPYFADKGISRRVTLKKLSDHWGEFVAVPMSGPEGHLVGLQKIYGQKVGESQKWFTAGTVKKGAYYLFGDKLTGEEELVFLAEGWATAASVHLATGAPVVCAFDCNNLEAMLYGPLKGFARSQIVLAADNDQWKEVGNAGLRAGLTLSYRHQIKVRAPQFSHLGLSGLEEAKPTDFNDLMTLAGVDEVRRQLLSPSHASIVCAPRTAIDYHIGCLALVGSQSTLRKKHLQLAVKAGLRKGLSVEDLERRVPSALAGEVAGHFAIAKKRANRRVARYHDFASLPSGVNLIEFEPERQTHGGYIIPVNLAEERLRDLEGIVIIKAPMGSGKTEGIIKKLLACSIRAAYMVHRVSLAVEGARRLDILCYRLAEAFDVLGSRFLATCLNSITHRRFQGGAWFQELDRLFIDEGSKVLDHLAGPTIDDHEAITSALLAAIESAKQVVICDADASTHLVELLQRLFPTRPIHVVRAVNAPMDHVAVDMISPEGAFAHVLKEALAGQKILVACDSKKGVKRLAAALAKRKRGIKTLAIYSESRVDPNVEPWIRDPNGESKKWDVVIYNSAVDSGVSITVEHFDHTVGIFSGVVTPDTVKQMMGRNRLARRWLLACKPVIPTRRASSQDDMYKALIAANYKVRWEERAQKLAAVPELTPFDQIRLAMAHRKLNMSQDYVLSLQTMLEQDGYVLNHLETKDSLAKRIRREVKELGEEITAEWHGRILAAKTPSFMRYRELKQAYAVSEDEFAELVRFDLQNALGVKSIEAEDVAFWLDNTGRKDLNFELMQAAREDLLAYDSYDIKTTKSLTKRRNLLCRGDLLREMFEHLGLDRVAGEGLFSHVEAQSFVDHLLANENRRLIWNYFRMGSYLAKDQPPRDPTKFVQEALKKLGLTTRKVLKSVKRLANHTIDPLSWAVMARYLACRQEAGKYVAKIPETFSEEIDREAPADHPQELGLTLAAQFKAVATSHGEQCVFCWDELSPVELANRRDLCEKCRIIVAS